MKTTIKIILVTSLLAVGCLARGGSDFVSSDASANVASPHVRSNGVAGPVPDAFADRTCNVEKMNGRDVGEKINACDKMLGSQKGEIRLTGGGRIDTQIVISSNHTLRVISGNYPAMTNGAVIRLRDNSSLICDSWTPTLEESKGVNGVTSPFTIVTPYNGASIDAPNGSLSQNILIKGCHFKGARSDFNSAPPAVHVGACHNCRVEGNWLESTRAIGINVGASATLGHYAQNVHVIGNQLTSVASQNISVTNADTVTISNNRMLSPGQIGGPGCAPFDIEPNDSGDRVTNISFTDNVIDASKNNHASVIFGIVVQNGPRASPFGNIEIKNNRVIGADYSQKDVDWIIVAGILVRAASGVRVEGNYVQRVPSGIFLDYGSSGNTVSANKLVSCGSGSTNALVIENSNDNRIVGNILYNEPTDVLALPDGIVRSIVERGTSNNNVFSQNQGVVTLAGNRSKKTP